MSFFDDMPLENFGQVQVDSNNNDNGFPLMDVNNNYLPQPFTHEEDSNGSIFDPDNNLLPPESEIEGLPLDMPLIVPESIPVSIHTAIQSALPPSPSNSVFSPLQRRNSEPTAATSSPVLENAPILDFSDSIDELEAMDVLLSSPHHPIYTTIHDSIPNIVQDAETINSALVPIHELSQASLNDTEAGNYEALTEKALDNQKQYPPILDGVFRHVSNYKSNVSKFRQAPRPSPKRQPLASLPVNCDVPPPRTPQKGADILLDPITPTANLKMLLSAVSPELRNRDNMRRLLQEEIRNQQQAVRERKFVMDNNGFITDSCGPANFARKEKSLGLLCQRFLELFPENALENVPVLIGLDDVSLRLGVERRRIYDIVNVLESVDMCSRVGKNKYQWHGRNRLLYKLKQLKDKAILEGYIKKLRLVLSSTAPGSKNPNIFLDPHSVLENRSKKALLEAKCGMRKDKSLGILSEKFVMLFLVAGTEIISLELAAKLLSEESEAEKQDAGKMKTKIRRLYDVANILISLNLIEKLSTLNTKGRKPGFRYIGPWASDHNIEAISSITESKNVNESEKRKTRGRSKVIEKKTSFARHSSFDLICRAAEEERTKLYCAQPSSSITGRKDSIKNEQQASRPPTTATSSKFILHKTNGTNQQVAFLRKSISAPTNPQPQLSASTFVPSSTGGQTAPCRVIKLTRPQYLTLDNLRKSQQLVITDVNKPSEHQIVTSSTQSAPKRTIVITVPNSKRCRIELADKNILSSDSEVAKLTETLPLIGRVKSELMHRRSPRALQFDNIVTEKTSVLAQPLPGTYSLEDSENTRLKTMFEVQVPVLKKSDEYMTPVRIYNDKDITPSAKNALFQSMKAKLASPEAGKPPRSILGERCINAR